MGLRLDVAERGGDQVAVARDVTIAVGERTLIKSFTGTIQRGEVVGFVGPNGSGKSTFLRALVGDRDIIGGELRLGGSVQPSYYRQDMAQVPLDRTLFEVISDLQAAVGAPDGAGPPRALRLFRRRSRSGAPIRCRAARERVSRWR